MLQQLGIIKNDENSETSKDRVVNTSSVNRNRMFAEKLVLSYPLWHGMIDVSEEYTNTHTCNLFTADIPEIRDTDNTVDERNITVFVEIGQHLGRFNMSVGLRYENVKFSYSEMGTLREGQSKTYNNLFPSLNIATQAGNVSIGLNLDTQLMTLVWDNNMKIANTPWYVNAKIYKGFFNNTFSVTLDAKYISDSDGNNFMMYSDAVQIAQKNFSPGRSVMLTLKYCSTPPATATAAPVPATPRNHAFNPFER